MFKINHTPLSFQFIHTHEEEKEFYSLFEFQKVPVYLQMYLRIKKDKAEHCSTLLDRFNQNLTSALKTNAPQPQEFALLQLENRLKWLLVETGWRGKTSSVRR